LASWATVYLVTQVIADPALGVGTTFLIGTGLMTLLTVGYPSVLRGPRLSRPAPRRRSRFRPESQTGRTIAAAGQSMPLRSGLTAEAAQRTVKLLHPLLGGDAVAVT